MEKGQKKIRELFDGRKIFTVPQYQRSYAWEQKQIEEYFNDLNNQKLSKEYFLGTILFREIENNGEFSNIEIVDGQQRITTSIIFMKVLLNELEKKKENEDSIEIIKDTYIKYKNKVKLEVSHEDNEFFQTYIIGDQKNAEEVMNTPSQRRLFNAKHYFTQQLSNLNIDQLRELKNKLEKAKVLTYSVSDPSEAALIFETTNDRGRVLTNLEKIKSFLMYKSYLSDEDDTSTDLINNIYDRFGEIYRTTDKIHEKEPEVKEDSILQYNFVSYSEWEKKKDYQKYLLNIKDKINYLIKNEPENVINFIDNYSRKLRESFEIFLKILNHNDTSIRNLYLLKRMGIIFYPLLIKTYQYDETDKKYNFGKVAKLLEIFSFRILGFKFRRSNDIDPFLNSLTREFEGDYDFLIWKLKEKILELAPDNLFKEKLSSHNFYNEFANNDKNYLFWKYENYLRKIGKYSKMSEEEFSIQDTKYKLSIEHIASQNPKITTDQLKFEEMTDEFKEQFLHNIGNLTFDPQSANSSKGNKPFPEKNSKYFQKAPFMSQNELDEFLDSSKWTRKSIQKRRHKIIKFALERWNPSKYVDEELSQKFSKEELENKAKTKSLKKNYDDSDKLSRIKDGDLLNYVTDLRSKIIKLAEDVEEHCTKYRIVFDSNKNFCYIACRKDYLNIDLRINVNPEDYPDLDFIEENSEDWDYVKVTTKTPIESLLKLIKLAYDNQK